MGAILGPGGSHRLWGKLNLCATTNEARALQQEKPSQQEAHAPQPESPCLPQLEKACPQQQRPSTTKIQYIHTYFKKEQFCNFSLDHKQPGSCLSLSTEIVLHEGSPQIMGQFFKSHKLPKSSPQHRGELHSYLCRGPITAQCTSELKEHMKHILETHRTWALGIY